MTVEFVESTLVTDDGGKIRDLFLSLSCAKTSAATKSKRTTIARIRIMNFKI
jgi:hypothetical protein